MICENIGDLIGTQALEASGNVQERLICRGEQSKLFSRTSQGILAFDVGLLQGADQRLEISSDQGVGKGAKRSQDFFDDMNVSLIELEILERNVSLGILRV